MRSICNFATKDEKTPIISPLRFVFETELKKFQQPFTSPCYKLMIVKSGTANLSVNGNNHLITRGTLCFFEPLTSYSLKMDDNFTVIYLDFNSSNLKEHFAAKSISFEQVVFSGQDELLTTLSSAVSMVRNYNSNALISACVLYTLSILSTFIKDKEKDKTTGAFGAILDFVNANFNDPMLSLKKLEETFSYSIKHLSRLFTINLGVGFSKYLNDLRLGFAVKLLDDGESLIKNVAYACGFLDPLYFSRAFKKRFNVSPTEYYKNSPKRVENDFLKKYS